MTQFESHVSGEELMSPAQVLPDEFIDDTNTEAPNIAASVLDLSYKIEHLERIDLWEIDGLDSEQVSRIVAGLAGARRALRQVAEVLMPNVVTADVPKPEEVIVPMDSSVRTKREDYGEGIFPSGTRFLIDVPDVGRKMIEFGDKGVIIDDSKLRLGPHQLYLLTLFLRKPQHAFTREDISNGGYHPRQSYPSNRLNHLSAQLSPFRRKLASALTGKWYSDGPIFSDHVGNHLAYAWVFPVVQQEVAESEEDSVTSQVESQPIEQVVADVSDDASLISDPSSEAYGQVDEPIDPETEVHINLEEDVYKSESIRKAEHIDTKTVLRFEDNNLFVNGKPVEVTKIESDVIRFMIVAGQTRSIKFEQLFKWLKPAHPRLNFDGLNTVIDRLNKPLRFYVAGILVNTENIESASGTSRQLTLGEGFAHRHLEDQEVLPFLAMHRN